MFPAVLVQSPEFVLGLLLCLGPTCMFYVPVSTQNKQNLLSKQIDLKGKEPESGVLISHTISDLRIPLSYEVRLAPITTYSTGDYISRIIQYSERKAHFNAHFQNIDAFSCFAYVNRSLVN